MKVLYIFLLLTLISCAQETKQKNITVVFSQEELVNKVVKELNLDESKVDFITSKASPSSAKETIIVIPEVVNEYEDVYELNSNIVIIDKTTGKITHKFFESSKTNGWVSDAVFIAEITIDTKVYKLNASEFAFGVIIKFRSGSQPNPYDQESISLFIKDKNNLKKILDFYTIYESTGEVNVNSCYANFIRTKNELSMNDSKTNGYNDILVKRANIQITHSEDENGECNPEEKIISTEEIVLKFNDDEYKETTSIPVTDSISFDKLIGDIKTKKVPLIDATNFDSFIDEDDYNKVDAQAFKLEKIYPHFYKEGYNYRAVASYRVDVSEDFYSVVVTVLKGSNEMESVLINYDFKGNIIDCKVVSYDEIAEGWSKIESKIEHNKLTINNILWMDEKQQTTEVFEIDAAGEITPVTSINTNTRSDNQNLVNGVIQQLNLNKLKVKTDFIVSMDQPNDSNETIVVIPEIVYEYEHSFALNSNIVLVNTTTGKITHTYFESSDTNAWVSDSAVITEIDIDTTPYMVSEDISAFGIRVNYEVISESNPDRNTTLSLFTKSGNTLKKMLYNYDVMLYGGERVSNCKADFIQENKVLNMSNKKTNGYFDIIVNSEHTEINSYEDENGECISKENITSSNTVLNFDGELYN